MERAYRELDELNSFLTRTTEAGQVVREPRTGLSVV